MDTATAIVVVGTGPAGMIAALAFAAQDLPVTLVGPAPRTDDRRTTAVMAPQLHYLQQLGLGANTEGEAEPLRAMRIIDGTGRLLRAPTVTFRASEIDEPWFGLNLQNSRFLATLAAAVVANPQIENRETLVEHWRVENDAVEIDLADGSHLRAALVVGADGRGSRARDAAGITVHTRPSRQSALVVNFTHARSHQSTSTEFHTEAGPFTQVPLPGNRSSLVWVQRPHDAEERMALDDVQLARQIEDMMQSMLGKVEIDGERQLYPLSSALPQRFAARRIALVGEAAHVFPPIGAQGLNLGIRDIQELVRTVGDHRHDPGAAEVLARYDRRRRPDILARASAVELLNRSLLSDLLPAQLARSAGLGLLERVAPLRALFMREGLRTGSGLSTLFAGSGKQIGR